MELSQNDDELYQERQKAMRNRDKYVGINSNGRPICGISSSGTMTSSKSCSFDDEFRSKRAQESIADEKKWQNQQHNSIQNDLYGRINDFTNKIKNILEHRKEDESSEDEGKNNKPEDKEQANGDELYERIDHPNLESNLEVRFKFFCSFSFWELDLGITFYFFNLWLKKVPSTPKSPKSPNQAKLEPIKLKNTQIVVEKTFDFDPPEFGDFVSSRNNSSAKSPDIIK